MYAEQVTGYVDNRKPITDVGFSGSVQCFLGHIVRQTDANPNPSAGGPENSLTLWGDKGDDQIVCDYGASETFMHYLAGRFGARLHHGPAPRPRPRPRVGSQARSPARAPTRGESCGLGGHDRSRRRPRPRLPAPRRTTCAVPHGDAGERGQLGERRVVREARRAAERVRLRPPPEGQHVPALDADPLDRVRRLARRSRGDPSNGRSIRARSTTPATPRCTRAAAAGSTAASSDACRCRRVAARLTFATRYDLATGRDFGFVQVSTNGGKSWRSLAGNLTTTSATRRLVARPAEPARADRSIGWGPLPIWTTATYDLAAYRGRTVLLAFRYVSDPRVAFPGWWIDDVRLGQRALTDGRSSPAGSPSRSSARRALAGSRCSSSATRRPASARSSTAPARRTPARRALRRGPADAARAGLRRRRGRRDLRRADRGEGGLRPVRPSRQRRPAAGRPTAVDSSSGVAGRPAPPSPPHVTAPARTSAIAARYAANDGFGLQSAQRRPDCQRSSDGSSTSRKLKYAADARLAVGEAERRSELLGLAWAGDRPFDALVTGVERATPRRHTRLEAVLEVPDRRLRLCRVGERPIEHRHQPCVIALADVDVVQRVGNLVRVEGIRVVADGVEERPGLGRSRDTPLRRRRESRPDRGSLPSS